MGLGPTTLVYLEGNRIGRGAKIGHATERAKNNEAVYVPSGAARGAIVEFGFPSRKPVARHGAGNQPCDRCRNLLEFRGRENVRLATVYDVRPPLSEPLEIVPSPVSLRILHHFGSFVMRCPELSLLGVTP